MKKYLIPIIGSHGVGKTTLLNDLRGAWNDTMPAATFLDEVPRRVCESMKDSDYFKRGKNSWAKQLCLIVDQSLAETQALNENSNTLLVADRCAIDHL